VCNRVRGEGARVFPANHPENVLKSAILCNSIVSLFTDMEIPEQYDPNYPAMNNEVHTKEQVLYAARQVLVDSGELYDPENYKMNITEKDHFRYSVYITLWRKALHRDLL